MVLNFTIVVVADLVPIVGNLGVRNSEFSMMVSNFTIMVLANLVVMVYSLDAVLGNLVNSDDLWGDLRLQLTYLDHKYLGAWKNPTISLIQLSINGLQLTSEYVATYYNLDECQKNNQLVQNLQHSQIPIRSLY
jgi:hypothetical protein